MTYDDVLLFNTKHQRKIIISFVELVFSVNVGARVKRTPSILLAWSTRRLYGVVPQNPRSRVTAGVAR